MPKIVDHDARRRELVEAARRAILRVGLEAATMQEIAKEASFSTGVLAHYFADKSAILSAAHRASFETIVDRIRETIKEVVTLDDLTEAIYHVLPLDETRYAEAQLDVAFWDEARRHETFRKERWKNHLDAQRGWMECFANLRKLGALESANSDEELAIELQIIVDGLVVHSLLYPEQMTHDRMRGAVQKFVGTLTPKES